MQKTFLLLVTLLIAVPQTIKAQRFQGIEFFGGYSYLQNNLSSTYSPFYVTPTPFGNDFALNGWQASITEKATDWLGLTQEFGGHYGTKQLQGINNHFSTFSILSGPRFFYPSLKVVTPFVHALLGYEQTTVKLTGLNLKATGTSYAMAFGGGIDAGISRRLAIRLLQVDYYRPQAFGSSQNNLRFSAGIVLRFGGRR
jgi:hypothetical protein